MVRQEHGMIEEDLGLPARRSYGAARCGREDDARSWWCGSVRGPRPAGVKTRLPQCRICEFAMGGGGSTEPEAMTNSSVLHVADAAVRRGAGDNLHGFFGWLQKGLGCLGYSRAYSPATAEAVEIPKAKTAASKKGGHDEEEASEAVRPGSDPE